MRARTAWIVAVAALGAACATTGPTVSPFDAAVAKAEARCKCRMGVAARHIETGRSYEHNGAAEFESASVIKIAVLTEAMAGVREGRVTSPSAGT